MHYHLERFVEAQDNVYHIALEEIRRGYKQSHWMWFIFPQLKALGRSNTARYYGITCLDEAKEYLNYPILGERLREITKALLQHADIPALTIFGSIDALKLKSCMTLFDVVSPHDIFQETLNVFCGGQADDKTIRLLTEENS